MTINPVAMSKDIAGEAILNGTLLGQLPQG